MELPWFTAPDRAANIPEFVNLKPDAMVKAQEKFVDDISYLRAGFTCREAGDITQAIQQFRTSLALNPSNADTHVRLGLALMEKATAGDAKEAFAHFSEAVRIAPRNPMARYNLAVMLSATDRDAAIAQYLETLRIDPSNSNSDPRDPRPLDDLAGAYVAAGHFKEAVATAQKALDLATKAGMNDFAGRPI